MVALPRTQSRSNPRAFNMTFVIPDLGDLLDFLGGLTTTE
jgi:hypothetical protein